MHELDEIIEAFNEHHSNLGPSFSDDDGVTLLCAIFGVAE